MRKKIILFLNISLFCLSLCSIVFGAYSLSYADISLNCQLGYTTRNSETFIEITITGAEKRTLDGNPTGSAYTNQDALIYKKVVATGETAIILSEENFGKLYFLNTSANITVKITLKNLSTTQKTYTLNTPVVNSGVTCSLAGVQTKQVNQNTASTPISLTLSTSNSNLASSPSGLVLHFSFS